MLPFGAVSGHPEEHCADLVDLVLKFFWSAVGHHPFLGDAEPVPPK